ncbi:hypothetical protein LTR08_007617 [Meristemomyces frigidus]|nr:hypothetical protein LTR08_007617 [Meristemomyces frigidus]
MILPHETLVRQKICIDFASLKHACPRGIYLTPVSSEPLTWIGVLFLKKGPYANAVLRFRVAFPEDYPQRPPVITFLSDVFHPMVTPLTTYTHTTRDPGTETVSSGDEGRLPPGGFSLRHGFPEWFESSTSVSNADADSTRSGAMRVPHIVEVLQYLRVAFDTEAVLDSVPLEVAANSGAWHAWRTSRSRTLNGRKSPSTQGSRGTSIASTERSTSPRQQPGGARRPGEWNWQGVWEDRVRKSIQASISEAALFGADGHDLINFLKMDEEALERVVPTGSTQSAV